MYRNDIIVDAARVSMVCEATRPDGSELTAADIPALKDYVTAKLARSKVAGGANAEASDFDEAGFFLNFSVEATTYVEPATYDYPGGSYSEDGDIEDVARETARDLVGLLDGGEYRITYELDPSDIKVETSEYEPDYDD